MSNLITDGQTLLQWLAEGLSGNRIPSSKWRDLWLRLVEGDYSDDQAELLFQRITTIGNNLGSPSTFKSRASEGRRVWRYSKLHRSEASAILRSGVGYHKMIAQFPTTIDTSWRNPSPADARGSFEEEILAIISELNDFELASVHAFASQLVSARTPKK